MERSVSETDAWIMERCMALSNGKHWEKVMRATWGMTPDESDRVRDGVRSDAAFRCLRAGLRRGS